MRYCVIKNIQQDEQLEQLGELHDKTIKNSKDDFKDLIRQLVSDIRTKTPVLIERPYINQIFISANQIVYSFNKFKEAKKEPFFDIDEKGNIIDINKELDKEEEAMVLVFFMNAKAFIDLIKRYTKIDIDDELVKDITMIRNCLAHFYDKKIEQREYFVNLSIEKGLREYSVLHAFDINSRELVYEICFSLDLFYFSLKSIFEQLKNNTSLFLPK